MPKSAEELTTGDRLFVKLMKLPQTLWVGSTVMTPFAVRNILLGNNRVNDFAYRVQYGVEPEKAALTVLIAGAVLLGTLGARSFLKKEAIFTDEYSRRIFAFGIIETLISTYFAEMLAQVNEPAVFCILIPAIIYYIASIVAARMYPEV